MTVFDSRRLEARAYETSVRWKARISQAKSEHLGCPQFEKGQVILEMSERRFTSNHSAL